MRRYPILATLGLGWVLLSGCSILPPQELTVEAGEFHFKPATITIKAGRAVKLTLENKGALEHDLWVRDLKATIRSISEGASHEESVHEEEDKAEEGTKSGNVSVHVKPRERGSIVFLTEEKGSYEIFCSLPGHEEQGMTARLVIE